MKLMVTDTETTGLGAEDQVVQLGIATLGVAPREGGVGCDVWFERAWSTLVRPTCPVSVGARATHHISDEELCGEQTMTELLLRRGLPEFGRPAEAWTGECESPDDVVLVAHNAEYDLRMLRQSGVHPGLLPARVICTYRCALKLLPDEESHKNQNLFYSLGLTRVFESDEPPHRALADAAVTGALVARMLETCTPEQLVEMTASKILLKKVGFSKNKGQLWKDQDVGFLNWVLQRDFSEEVKDTARHWLTVKSGGPRLVRS